jgi:hypothetical protein
METHTDEPLLLLPTSFEVEIAAGKFKQSYSSGAEQIPAELIQTRREILRSKIHTLVNSICNKEQLPE